MFPASKITALTTVNLTVRQRRSRRYLTGKEIERLMDCARKHGRYGCRDATVSRIDAVPPGTQPVSA